MHQTKRRFNPCEQDTSLRFCWFWPSSVSSASPRRPLPVGEEGAEAIAPWRAVDTAGGSAGGGADLTDEEIAALQKERNAFFEQTRDLRDKLYQKGLELRAEMAKQNPDAKKAAELQKEVSGLEGELDQKSLDQRLKMQKENPKLYGKGFGRGMGPGYGRGPGSGMGDGHGHGRRLRPRALRAVNHSESKSKTRGEGVASLRGSLPIS